MRVLRNILYKAGIAVVVGDTAVEVRALQFDSRKVEKGDVFVAIKGTQVDGHAYIENAIAQGAVAIVCEELPEVSAEGTVYVQVQDGNTALAVMAANFYGNPSQDLQLVGVTGTNGKTTVTTLLYQLFQKAGYVVGLLSTIRVMVGESEFKATHTTPDALAINAYLRKMADAGVEYCFMEVSSHGIHQKRTQGLEFAGAVFTNLTHDHLDYHNTFAAYRDTKKILFDQLSKKAFALVNLDDKNGLVMLQNTKAHKKTYALKTYADYQGQILERQFGGQMLRVDGNELWTPLIGDFNAYNLLAIYGTAIELGLGQMEALELMSGLTTVAGRFQYFISGQDVIAIVDYAHTPDALKNVLTTIGTLRTGNEKVITVVGCGGDRDKSKRPVMGHIASEMSDQVIFTSDNPRTESPTTIIEEMEAGVEAQNHRKVLSITNRRQAIKTACILARPKDVILVAGKGHEAYQEINGERQWFDDFEILKELLGAVR